MASAAQTERPTVLVVEDEFIIALDLSDTVRDLGYALEGPFAHTAKALEALETGLPDAAILDVFTADGEVFPVADALTRAGVPIIFHSAHLPPREVRERYPQALTCSKPCPPDRIIDMLKLAVERARQD